MDPDSLFSLLMIVLMLLIGTFFSAMETAFSALNRIRMKSMADEGNKRAVLVLRLHDNFDKLLSTLLVLNNAVTLIAAAISTLLFIRYFGDIGATLSTVILTIIIVFFGDITPKSLAKESPEKIALFSAPLLHFLMIMLTPVNFLFLKWKGLLSRIFKTENDDRMTEEELYSYVEEAQQDGVIDEEGRQLLDNAIEFNELRASDILTPRIDVAGISEDSTPEEVSQLFFETDYSRLPVYRESIDNIVGVVHMRDFFKRTIAKKTPLKDVITPPLFVAPSTKITDLFKLLQKRKSHLAIVADEYGGTAGIVTLEDILEELVGDIWDESDDIIVEFADLGDNRHKVICSAYVKDLFTYFNLQEDTDVESTSVSGWIMDMLGKVPEVGDTFTFENLTVTVHKAEHRRVLECIIEVKTAGDELETEDAAEEA
ncbi:MAG: hemolysin family protein [Defluviitaleaceae bacterium]|nr:hemolysin family protein [Defluviitaleaceae bacterium]